MSIQSVFIKICYIWDYATVFKLTTITPVNINYKAEFFIVGRLFSRKD